MRNGSGVDPGLNMMIKTWLDDHDMVVAILVTLHKLIEMMKAHPFLEMSREFAMEPNI